MGIKTTAVHQNVICVQISNATLQSTVTHIFYPFMATTQIAVLTAHGATACYLIFELSATILTVSDQQTKTGNVHVTECCGTNMLLNPKPTRRF